MKKQFLIILLFLFSFAAQPTHAQVKLPRLVRDSMVLQRDTRVNIWGWASPGETVNIKFIGKKYKTKAGKDGKWQVKLAPAAAGGPHSMEINGKNNIKLKDVLIGDVWICAGQSNMVHQMALHNITYANDIATANYPAIRHFTVPVSNNLDGPQNDLPDGFWKSANPVDINRFSVVAYFFAKDIYEKHKIPIGLINASVGGTPVEAWTSEEGLKEFPQIQSTIRQNQDTAYINELMRKDEWLRSQRPPSRDMGLLDEKKWYEPSYLPRAWRTINIPGYWEDQGIKDLDGVVWYRKEIDVPASMAGKRAGIYLGRIVDADALYVNGNQVGQTTYKYPQRRYTIPESILKAGKNLFVIRVTNQWGKGGFVPDKPYCLFADHDTIDLKGTWQYKVGEVFSPGSYMSPGFTAQNQPAALFNGMIAPLVPYSIRGFLWYQGEANTSRAEEYARLQPALIRDWRRLWGQEDLPFLYVQLPSFMDANYLPSESQWAALREAQLKSLSVSNTAMAVAIDLGEWNDIHPDNKKDVGIRLALAARKMVYGEDIVYSGPLFDHAEKKGNRVILHFSHTGTGLKTSDGNAPAEFAIAGDDKKFVWAKTEISGNEITVWHDAIKSPRYIRYAWADNPVNPNLYNREGLPASPFQVKLNEP